ncbi:MAG: DNA polymerase III subunit delta' [Gammaproteobacteria bacterium]|nr:DNA polymerase III subunit delta' [Gammaproteobacteria bacterium]
MADDPDRLNAPLPWHAACWERVCTLRETDRLPHALLLCGVRGMGKDRFARLLAHALLCETPADAAMPCGTCRSCRLTQAGTHPDLHRCAPEEDKSIINIDQIRAIGRFLELKAHYTGRKVVLIHPADQMNLSAANGLLKMLEEPPAGVHLILLSHRPAALPATVRSRCQRLTLALEDPRPALDWLARQPGIEPEEAAPLLALAQGGPLAAAELAAQGHLGRRQTMLQELQGIARRELDPLQVAENWLKFDAKASLYWLHGWLIDMIRLQAADRPPCVGNPDGLDTLSRLSSELKGPWLFTQLDRIAQALRLLEGPANAQLLLEEVLLPWAQREGERARVL